MMVDNLISLSLTPGPYFFSATAGPAASKPSAPV